MIAKGIAESLAHVWTTLKTLDIPMAIMGGIALAAWCRSLHLQAALAEIWDEAFPGETPPVS
jgi:hypothetical protein